MSGPSPAAWPTWRNLAQLDWATSHYAQAEERAEASLAIYRPLGNLRGQMHPLNVLSWINQPWGRLEDAERLRRQVLDLSQQLGDRSVMVDQMANLAFTLQWRGKLDEAHQRAADSLALCLELGQREVEGYARLAVCWSLLHTGEYEAACQEGNLALALTREAGVHGVEASVHYSLACLALNTGDFQAACAAFAESRRLYEEVQDNYLGLALPGPGYVACLERRCADARPYFVEALQFALTLRDYLYLIVALPGVALYFGLTDELVRAAEIWALAMDQPFVANSKWHADVVGQPLDAAAAALAPDDRRAARERGQALDLWRTAEALLLELGPMQDRGFADQTQEPAA